MALDREEQRKMVPMRIEYAGMQNKIEQCCPPHLKKALCVVVSKTNAGLECGVSL